MKEKLHYLQEVSKESATSVASTATSQKIAEAMVISKENVFIVENPATRRKTASRKSVTMQQRKETIKQTFRQTKRRPKTWY